MSHIVVILLSIISSIPIESPTLKPATDDDNYNHNYNAIYALGQEIFLDLADAGYNFQIEDFDIFNDDKEYIHRIEIGKEFYIPYSIEKINGKLKIEVFILSERLKSHYTIFLDRAMGQSNEECFHNSVPWGIINAFRPDSEKVERWGSRAEWYPVVHKRFWH